MTRLNTGLLATSAFALGGLTLGGIGDASAQRSADRPQLTRPDPAYVQQLSFADLVEDVSPAVVSIRTTQTVELRGRASGIPPEFERMFPQLRGRLRPQEPQERQGEGSGFFIDADGHVVTNNHVIDGADEIVVVLDSGKELIAELVGTDPDTDIAVLKVEPLAEQRYVQFSPEADLRVGDYVLAVGNPFGLGGTVTSGIVSAIGGDRARAGQYADFIQIDASINRGNSGGPTFDLRGNVVGVNTAIISPTGGNVGIGLAVPADTAAFVVDQIIDEGGVTRGWLGVAIGDVDELLASAVGLASAKGAIVQSVQEGSPAEKAGIEDGDVILAFGKTDIEGATSLTRTVGAMKPGEKAKVSLLRGGEEKSVTVRLEKREGASVASRRDDTGGGDERMKDELGVTFSALTPEMRRRMRLDDDVEGIVVTDVERGSDAADAGIRTGMVITEADNRALKNVADLERVVRMARDRKKDAVLVRVLTAQGADFRALPVNAG